MVAKFKLPFLLAAWVGFIGGLIAAAVLTTHGRPPTATAAACFVVSVASLVMLFPATMAVSEGWFECRSGVLRKHEWEQFLDTPTDRYSRRCKCCDRVELGTPVWMTYEGY